MRGSHTTLVRRGSFGAAFLFAAGITGAAPALAQDFGGIRVELITGYDNEGIDFDDDVFDGGKNGNSGWLYGFGAGFDYQTGNWVFGLETELSESTASRSKDLSGTRPTNPIAGVPTPVSTHIEFEAGGDWYIGGRVGYVVAPQWLLYGKVGYTNHKLNINGDGLDNGVPFEFDSKVKLDGFRLGVGAEYAFSKSLFAKAEYRYTNYNNGDLEVSGPNISLDPLFEGVDMVRHQVALAVGYRF